MAKQKQVFGGLAGKAEKSLKGRGRSIDAQMEEMMGTTKPVKPKPKRK